MNEFMDKMVEEEVAKIKATYAKKGYEMMGFEEIFLRYGISIGIMIAGQQ